MAGEVACGRGESVGCVAAGSEINHRGKHYVSAQKVVYYIAYVFLIPDIGTEGNGCYDSGAEPECPTDFIGFIVRERSRPMENENDRRQKPPSIPRPPADQPKLVL